MKVIGLTGGVGMGKSACASLLRARDVPAVDTDDLAREVVAPGQPALVDLQEAFGAAILDDSGALRRDELARIVFADATAREELERILHPRIRERWRARIDEWRREGQSKAVVVIPLLFETNAQVELSPALCVACSWATQRQRLLGRGWSLQEIERRNQAQLPIRKKMDLSDYVLWTEGSIEVLAAQLDEVLRRIESSAPR